MTMGKVLSELGLSKIERFDARYSLFILIVEIFMFLEFIYEEDFFFLDKSSDF